MADVEQRAEAEASAKGLQGQARKSYIGGVFNKIRQAHARAIQPGKGKTFVSNLNRRNRQLARARYKAALAPHEQAVADLKQQRRHELEQLSYERQPRASAAQLQQRILSSDLKPVRHVEGVDIGQQMAQGPNPALLREVYGQQQLPQALNLFPTPTLRKAARQHGVSAHGNREELIARLAAQEAPKAAPKPAPAERQRQRAIAQAIQHGAPDFPPGTLAAAQGKPVGKAEGAHPRSAARLARAERMLDDLRRHKGRGTYAGDIGYDERLLIAEIVSAQHGVRGERSAAGSVAPDQLRRIERQIAAARNPLDAKAQGKPAATPPPPAAAVPLSAYMRSAPPPKRMSSPAEQAAREARKAAGAAARDEESRRRASQAERQSRNAALKARGYRWHHYYSGEVDNRGMDHNEGWGLLDPSGTPIDETDALRRIGYHS